MKIWSKRWIPAYREGLSATRWTWKLERECTSETMVGWLAVFSKDEPGIDFVVTDGKQTEKVLLKLPPSIFT